MTGKAVALLLRAAAKSSTSPLSNHRQWMFDGARLGFVRVLILM
ncbi:MAG: hypothetical protein ACFB22_08405 [Rhodothalassiaceae bacterium]